MPSSLVRSVLYIPALHEKALAKAATLPCDSVIFDLEDAIPPDQKDQARASLCTALVQGAFSSRKIIIRINAPDTPWYKADLAALAHVPFDAVLLPKIRMQEPLQHAYADIAPLLHKQPQRRLWAMVETPEIVLNAASFAAAHSRNAFPLLEAWVLGINDLMKETGAVMLPRRETMQHWLSTTVLLARATQCLAIDGVFNALDDQDGFADECLQAKNFGFDGKTVIHPSQLETANWTFSPSAAHIADAQALIEAFALPENQNRGVIAFKGRMAERLHLHMAEKILAQAAAIHAQGY